MKKLNKAGNIYHSLNEEGKKSVRNAYLSSFGVTAASFYNALKVENLSGRQLKFFSKAFSVPMEDLLQEPQPDDTDLSASLSNRFGLSK